MTEIYYIEDDENIATAVKEYLSQKGYAVSTFVIIKNKNTLRMQTGNID